jgi:hypothetical protein
MRNACEKYQASSKMKMQNPLPVIPVLGTGS